MRKNVLCGNAQCDQAFEQYHGKHLYCSRECYRHSTQNTGGAYKKKPKRRKLCKLGGCKNVFETALVKQVFCSADCYYEYWENQKVAADQRVCLFCEEIFESSHHAKVYCSHGCYKKAQKLRRQNLR